MAFERDGSVFGFAISILCILAVNVAIVFDTFDLYELQIYFPTSHRFTSLKNRTEKVMQYVSKYLFGVKSSNTAYDTENTEEYEGWANFLLSHTKDAIEISEYNILSDIRTLESRLEQKRLLS